MSKIKLIATTAMGLESVAKRELLNLGYRDFEVENGKITLKGDFKDICYLNLWLRTVARIKWEIGTFEATSFDELFEKTKALPWAEILPEDAEFPVVGKSVKSQLHSVPDCQAIVKKAIVENLKASYNTSWFEEKGPFYKIEVALHKDQATLSIDTTGRGLHIRGYRYYHSEAPLKETLAAAMIYLTNWTPDKPFVDPFCGSGTLPIEAAMIGQNIAPGFNRDFISEQWPNIDRTLWDRARQEVEDVADYDRVLDITGHDIDHRMIELSTSNAQEVGLHDVIRFKQMQVTDFNTQTSSGYMVGNPPYGERMNERKQVAELYQQMGKVLNDYPTWSFYFLTSHPDFETLFGRQASKKRKLFNGTIETHYYQFFGKKSPKS
ncbi:THUMP domain-containing class I SAM-dependent RNA methyltransferase [Tuberibacillus sp. Marseille-P3662]|uniref:THUMP domain-containing class I SAM-dependent RNA methyltransferase n=1 Tax=Tuberibacillus sp. Marseille-P3662 TaxID=1965358 RepID=UPI001C383C1A|nr:class I SAM-dependent RNA methyltransferase [Tuberibacillus sp. Marseille-P3662]